MEASVDLFVRALADVLRQLPMDSSSTAPLSLPQHERKQIVRIAEDLGDVKKNWDWIKALLADAEQRQIHEELVRLWLRDLKCLAEQTEDLLDLYEYEVVKKQVQASEAASSSGHASTSTKMQVRPDVITSLSPLLDAPFRKQIAGDLRRIKREFRKIAQRKEDLHLREVIGPNYSSNVGIGGREPTGHVATDTVFLGRERQMKELRDILLADRGDDQSNAEPSNVEPSEAEPSNVGPQVIAVVGMGGAGKTTLAQHICDDPEIKENFKERGWAHVSENPDVIRVTKAIVKAFKGDSSLNELSALQNEAIKSIQGKKVLIVMDDVWETTNWESFVAPLRYARKGSKILVTTRLPDVVNDVGAVKSIQLGTLPAAEGLSLLMKHAFPNQSSNGVDNLEELEEIGKRIVDKCGGLPLSIKLLGRLLRSKGNDEDEWTKVSESSLLEHGVKETEQIIGSLYFSYLHLSPTLKSCFKHCATYPNHTTGEKHLKYSWMAHGLVKDKKEAAKCLKELGSRYFLDVNKFSRIAMHDHIYDLARFALGESRRYLNNFYSRLIEHTSLLRLIEHMSLPNCLQELELNGEIFTFGDGCESHMKCLRIFTLFKTRCFPQWVPQLYNLRYLCADSFYSPIELPESIGDLRNLRWLILDCSPIKNLPEAISRLINLQQLSLEDSEISYLPETISELVKLEELHLYGCRLKELPKGITCLTSLQILNLQRTGISFMPKGFGALTKLEYLTDYVVNSEKAGLAELKNMKHLKDVIVIKNLLHVASEEDASQAEMANKKHLRVLFLCWDDTVYKEHDSQDYGKELDHIFPVLDYMHFEYDYYQKENLTDVLYEGAYLRSGERSAAHREEGIFQQLMPHHNVERVFISDYAGTKFPSWMGDQLFTKLVRLQLYHIHSCTSLSPMDQLPSLEHLLLECMGSLVELFPDQSVTSVDTSHQVSGQGQPFPKLEFIEINFCPSLESIPLHKLTSLVQVWVESCFNLKRIDPSYDISFPQREVIISDCPEFEVFRYLNFPRPSWNLQIDSRPVDADFNYEEWLSHFRFPCEEISP